MKAESDAQDDLAVVAWDPERHVRKVAAAEARLSRGFLRCEAAKWFPGFAMQWVPLIHSLGAEIKIRSVEPRLHAPEGLSGFAGTVDDEPLAIVCDHESARVLLNALAPGAVQNAQPVLREYLARRLLASLALSWSGPESSVVLFDASLNPAHIREAGAFRIELSVNDHAAEVWLLLGRFLVERLDGLWKRQLRSTTAAKAGSGPLSIGLEVTQLAVPPSLLSEYMKPRAVIDLEVVMSDRAVVRSGDRALAMARICNVEGRLGFEIIEEAAPAPRMPEGTTRVAIELCRLDLDAAQFAELSQAGAVWQTERALNSIVDMVINGQKVAEAELMLYEGRFAMRVR